MSNNEKWIFLSHSNNDYEKVRRVRNILEDMSMRPLMFFLKCLNDNDEIEDLIKREIKARTRFVLCDSENARQSNWVKREIEYINELHKPHDVIDIYADDESIREQLKNCFRRDHIFVSYPRELLPAINIVYDRLSKYDFCTSFIDRFEHSISANLLEEIEGNIKQAVTKGKFVSLLCSYSLRGGRFSQYELELAMEYDTSHKAILPIYLDSDAKRYFERKLEGYDSIDLSQKQTPHDGLPNAKDIPIKHGVIGSDLLGDDIVNAILVRLQGWGNIETYAESFRFGLGFNKDTVEADKLGELVVEHLEKVDSGNHFNGPGMLIRLGKLFKEGRVVRQDFQKARDYYWEARHDWGIAIDKLLDSLPSEPENNNI